jgi:hypothetical protein
MTAFPPPVDIAPTANRGALAHLDDGQPFAEGPGLVILGLDHHLSLPVDITALAALLHREERHLAASSGLSHPGEGRNQNDDGQIPDSSHVSPLSLE